MEEKEREKTNQKKNNKNEESFYSEDYLKFLNLISSETKIKKKSVIKELEDRGGDFLNEMNKRKESQEKKRDAIIDFFMSQKRYKNMDFIEKDVFLGELKKMTYRDLVLYYKKEKERGKSFLKKMKDFLHNQINNIK